MAQDLLKLDSRPPEKTRGIPLQLRRVAQSAKLHHLCAPKTGEKNKNKRGLTASLVVRTT